KPGWRSSRNRRRSPAADGRAAHPKRRDPGAPAGPASAPGQPGGIRLGARRPGARTRARCAVYRRRWGPGPRTDAPPRTALPAPADRHDRCGRARRVRSRHRRQRTRPARPPRRLRLSGLPSAALDEAAWDAAHARLVGSLQDLIRIPSVNPPDPPGGELLAARYLAGALDEAG